MRDSSLGTIAVNHPSAEESAKLAYGVPGRPAAGDNRRFRGALRVRPRPPMAFQSHVLRPFIVGSDMPASITIRPEALSFSDPPR